MWCWQPVSCPAPSSHSPPPATGYRPRDPSHTALYQLVAEQHATFAEVAQDAGGLPSFVEAAFERYLSCGVLARGFARFNCGDCGHDHLVALSCKTRGLCPSCGGRRMMSLTRHLMGAELPHVAVRQWVLSLPYPLRYRLAYDHTLCTAVHRALAAAVTQRMRRLARARGHKGAQTGSVTFVQRYGGGLNLNVHLHQLGLDGWFHRLPDGQLTFERAPVPTQREVEALVLSVHARVMRLLDRNGLLEVDADDPLVQDTPGLSACYQGAVTQRVALGPGRGRPVMKLGQSLQDHLASAPDRLARGGLLCAQVDGFDLHGRVAFGPTQRARIEQLVRYCARPPLAEGRLTKLPDGHYLLRLKTPWRDGTTHLRFEPIELMERLAAQIPKPRINLVLYAGVLAPNAKLRAEVIQYGRSEPPRAEAATETLTRAERERWSELMRVTFDLDMLACPRCGGRLRHIATILDRASVQKILEHLGLPARAPPSAPPRRPPPFWLDEDAA
jgi:DNA-directed RNA polymerase subunit RPC12/RpoP